MTEQLIVTPGDALVCFPTYFVTFLASRAEDIGFLFIPVKKEFTATCWMGN